MSLLFDDTVNPLPVAVPIDENVNEPLIIVDDVVAKGAAANSSRKIFKKCSCIASGAMP